jgi:hypothetical protein
MGLSNEVALELACTQTFLLFQIVIFSRQKLSNNFYPLTHRLMRLHAFVEDFVAYEDVVGVLPTADVDEPKRGVRLAYEDRDSFA